MDKKTELIGKLEAITKEPGFIHTLAILLKNDLFFDPNEAADIDWRERLSFQELNFLLGLFIKHPIKVNLITKEETAKQAQRIYEAFRDLHTELNSYIPEILKEDIEKTRQMTDKEKKDLMKEKFGSGEIMTEAIFYGNSGAYDFEYWEFAPKKYKYDELWLKKNRGIEMKKMALISQKLKKLSEQKKLGLKKPASFEEYCHFILNIFTFNRTDLLKDFDEKTVTAFLENFSIKPGIENKGFLSIGQYNVMESHPIIRLDDDKFFLPISFSLAQSIYESPFYWMAEDKVYKDKSFEHRGSTNEEIAIERLEKIFGVENIYRNVKVKKSKKETISDIDILVLTGNKSIIIQSKAKRLTELSKKGDKETLKKDFQKAIQDAYDQGVVCRETLLSGTNKLIDEDGNELSLKEPIEDAYIICLTSDTYPAITHQVDVYLQKSDELPYPVAISIFDLDILCFYLQDPFEFLYYLRQRIDLSEYFRGTSEIALLGWHLKRKLFRDPDADMIFADESLAQLIDANFPALKGHQPITEATERLHHSWYNKDFEKLIAEVKNSQIAGFTDALFYLYDLAGDGADRLIEAINSVKIKTRIDPQIHDVTMIFEEGKSGVSFICMPDSIGTLDKHILTHAMARKYKTKADLWLGIGSYEGSKRMVDSLVFSKEKWMHDENLEKVEKIALKTGKPMTVQDKKLKKIGRNDACFCNSGKKYKKCCLNKV
ncbi:MAG: SEC-C metal-binding domain-containing protein [Candidatus Gracilibacteria bacterium]